MFSWKVVKKWNGMECVYTYMYWCAKIIHLELIGHFTKRLKTILAFGLLKPVHFGRLVTLLFITHNSNTTGALNLNISF